MSSEFILALLLLFANQSCATEQEAPLAPEEAALKCSEFSALYTNIDADLARWKPDMISRRLMQQTIMSQTTRKISQKGFAAGFWRGKAYILDEPNMTAIGHHASLFLTYMLLLVHLENKFVMPDVDFVINTIDRPVGLILNASSKDEPVFRFCKGNNHADILIPIFHFHTKDYDNSVLAEVVENDKMYPWGNKVDKVFGRFSLYGRHVHPEDTSMPPRRGAGGIEICNSSRTVTTCIVRKHFVDWSRGFPDDLDVKSGGRFAILDHAQYKYLLHLDGQGLSSRMDQLLPLNSLVFKEESGYRAFYHHLLRPYEHYVPFWKESPEDILHVLKWARENDEDAKRITQDARRFAMKYLNKEARACYWYHLLVEFSKLLDYKPGLEPDDRESGTDSKVRQYMDYYKPVEAFVAEVVAASKGMPYERLMRLKEFAP